MIDIALVAALLYQVYKLLKGSVAIKIFLGFLSLYLIYLLVQAIRMELLSIILGQFMGVGVIAAIIIFAPEFRKFLLILGRSSIFSNDNGWKDMIFFWKKKENSGFNISPIIDATKVLAGSNTGALIVISSTVELKFYAESGDILDAELSKRLLLRFSISIARCMMEQSSFTRAKSKRHVVFCQLPNAKYPRNLDYATGQV